MRKSFIVTLCILLVFSMAGCWDQLLLEKIAFIFGMAIDEDPLNPDMFYMGVKTPAFAEGAKENSVRTVVLTRSISQGLINMQLQRERNLALGKVNVIIFSTAVAENGIMYKVIRQMDQQRDINPNSWLAITQGISARETLYLKPPEEERVAIYLDDLLDIGLNTGQIPEATISQFWSKHHAWGVTPAIPTIKKTENDSLMISGLALINEAGNSAGLFNDGETVMYMIITGEMVRGRFNTKVDYHEQKDRWATSYVKKSKSKVNTWIDNNTPVIDIRLELDLEIINIDMEFEDVLTKEIFDTLQTAMAEDLQGNILQVIEKAQRSGVDPFGLGQYVRIQHPSWAEGKTWCVEFPESKVSVQVKVKVKRIGTLMNPSY